MLNVAPLFARSRSNMSGIDIPFDASLENISDAEVLAAMGLPSFRAKDSLLLPEVSEPEVCRHFTKLSQKNFSIDTNTYPLGSCTMKYNPKINEWAARLGGYAQLHPYAPERDLQGPLSLIWDLQQWLCAIGGFHETSMQPAAGAHGEFVGVLMMMKALEARGERRSKMLVPTSAHGTNPATAAFFGLEVVPIGMDNTGCIDLADLKAHANVECVGIMITNPNTLGIFEKDIVAICHIMHDVGAFVYGDGANLNALMGQARPGDFGIDVMHFNLHKTFTTPHGGGGPGCGAVGASKSLAPFLPIPLVNKRDDGQLYFDYERENSVGRIRSFYGNFGMMVRAWAYMREMGCDGLKRASEFAVLNANYVRARLKDYYHLPFITDSLHEVVFSDKKQSNSGVSTMDIAKRILDFDIHAPTVYFPLVVSGALMIEPTETESKYDLDALCDAFVAIAKECENNPDMVKKAPHTTDLCRLNEAKAAREPVLTWH